MLYPKHLQPRQAAGVVTALLALRIAVLPVLHPVASVALHTASFPLDPSPWDSVRTATAEWLLVLACLLWWEPTGLFLLAADVVGEWEWKDKRVGEVEAAVMGVWPVVAGEPGFSKRVAVVVALVVPRFRQFVFQVDFLPSAAVAAATVALSIATGAVLLGWQRVFVQRANEDALARLPPWPVVVAALGNAVSEEVVSRGVVLREVEAACGFQVANVVQALSFGAWHYHGTPSGMVGVCLTTLYGLLMGWLLQFSGSLVLPIVCHTLADTVIFHSIFPVLDR